MNEWNVRRIQHVSITRPHGSDEEARRFYGEVLGLTEIAVPETLRDMDLIWYQVGADELHLVGEENPNNGNSGRHFTIEVDDLEGLRRQLASAGVAIQVVTPIPGRLRFFVTDPFGNGIEFTEIQAS
jgi:catechol 2,3-dioxygenase-like lactoylglutathione lyase family enzyme